MIRRAVGRDERRLRRLDRAGWSTLHSPGGPPMGAFDTSGTLVYEVDRELAGYMRSGPISPLDSTRHVRLIHGLLVDERYRGRGIGRALVTAAIEQAELDGMRKLTLRVLGHNAAARALYEACGFEEIGRVGAMFYLDGAYVDDVWMALDLTASG